MVIPAAGSPARPWSLRTASQPTAAPASQRPPAGAAPRAAWLGLGSVALATVLWGLSNVVLRQVEAAVPPLPLILLRFGLIALLTLPVWIRTRPHGRLLAGLLLAGASVGLATAAQATAIVTIPVDQMAFIGALYVVLTPAAVALWRRRWPGWALAAAMAGSLGGVALLTGQLRLVFAAGTWWALGGAAGITLQIVILGAIAPRLPPTVVTAWQSVGATAALLVWFAATRRGPALAALQVGAWSWAVWGGIAYLAVCGGVLAFWLQARGQQRASPAATALTLNTEPLWTAVFAWLALGETLAPLQVGGALLTVGSLSASQWLARDRS